MAIDTLQYKDTGAYYNSKRLLTETDGSNLSNALSATTGTTAPTLAPDYVAGEPGYYVNQTTGDFYTYNTTTSAWEKDSNTTLVTNNNDGTYTITTSEGVNQTVDTRANALPYVNTTSGLTAVNVQGAIDELSAEKAVDTDVVHKTGDETVAGVKTLSVNPILSSTTQGSVLFAGASGVVSQDNANLHFDDTKNILAIGTNTPADLAFGTTAVKGLVVDSGSPTTSGLKFKNLTHAIASSYTSTVLGTTGSAPVNIGMDSAGNIYTVNIGSNNISKITPSGVSTILGTTGTTPWRMVRDSVGNIYTANAGSNDVSKITPAGVSTILGTTGSLPRGIGIDSVGNIYTANAGSNDVSKITPAGVSTILGGTGSGPQALVIDSIGNVYTANNLSHNVTKITPAGVSTVFGTTGTNPRNITIDSAGNIYTTNYGSNNITKITPAGVSTVFGTTGSMPGSITIDSANNIYTVNGGSANISKITPAGVSTIIATTADAPSDLILDSAGNIYLITDGVDNVSKLTPPVTQPKGLSVNATGDIVLQDVAPSVTTNTLAFAGTTLTSTVNGTVATATISNIAITNVTVVSDIAARDALTVETGDVAKVVDSDGAGRPQTYIYDGTTWIDIQETSDVLGVFGRTGSVTAQAGDYTADKITYSNTTSGLTAVQTQAAIDEVNAKVNTCAQPGEYIKIWIGSSFMGGQYWVGFGEGVDSNLWGTDDGLYDPTTNIITDGATTLTNKTFKDYIQYQIAKIPGTYSVTYVDSYEPTFKPTGSAAYAWLKTNTAGIANLIVETDEDEAVIEKGTYPCKPELNFSDIDNSASLQTSGVDGSIQFAQDSVLTSDSSNLFWDNTNKRLGVGTNTPGTKLDVAGQINLFDGTKTLNAGMATEVNTQIVNVGLNEDQYARFGGVYDSSYRGGLFRVDTRAAFNLFQWHSRKTGSTDVMRSVMGLSEDGNLWLGGENGTSIVSQMRLSMSAAKSLSASSDIINNYFGFEGWTGSTTNATVTEIFVQGLANNRYAVPVNSTVGFEIVISAKDIVTGDAAIYKVTGGAKNIAGTVSIVGTIVVNVIAEDDVNWDVDVVTNSDKLVINVTGDTANTVQWVAQGNLVITKF